jgi:hypothetical protein
MVPCGRIAESGTQADRTGAREEATVAGESICPTPEQVEADVLALIPCDGVTKRPEGYFVCLRLGEDRVRVGGNALCSTLADWHDSNTGNLQAVVEEAVSELIRRGQQAR